MRNELRYYEPRTFENTRPLKVYLLVVRRFIACLRKS